MGFGLVIGFIDSYNSQLQARIMLSLFYTLHKSLQDTLGLLSRLQSSVAVTRLRLPTVDFLLPLGF
jgi:hypothetical protein